MKASPHYFRSTRRAWWVSLVSSAAAHLTMGLLTAVTAWQFGISGGAPQISTVVPAPQFEAGWTLKSLMDSEQVVAQPADDKSHSPEINASALGLEEMIRSRVDREVAKAEGASDEELIARLRHLGDRLENVSSSEGVDEVATVLESSLGITKRATPGESSIPAGGFDHTSAQIENVTMSTREDGVVTYIATMSDAAGRQIEVELDEADGKQLYDTFQLMNRYPLLKQVYRKVIMGLMDKMLQEGDRGTESAKQGPGG